MTVHAKRRAEQVESLAGNCLWFSSLLVGAWCLDIFLSVL